MAELMEITRALEQVQDYNPLQRVLLTCAGTLQGTLSAYFGAEVAVRIQRQDHQGNGIIYRSVSLLAGPRVVCTADSALKIARKDIRQEVLARQLGIGQILEKLGVTPRFDLLEVGHDPECFWREYELKAEGVSYRITEVFPSDLYQCRCTITAVHSAGPGR